MSFFKAQLLTFWLKCVSGSDQWVKNKNKKQNNKANTNQAKRKPIESSYFNEKRKHRKRERNLETVMSWEISPEKDELFHLWLLMNRFEATSSNQHLRDNNEEGFRSKTIDDFRPIAFQFLRHQYPSYPPYTDGDNYPCFYTHQNIFLSFHLFNGTCFSPCLFSVTAAFHNSNFFFYFFLC